MARKKDDTSVEGYFGSNLEILMEGNKRWRQGELINQTQVFSIQKKQEILQRKPLAIIIKCIDHRYSPQHIFDQKLSQLFVLQTHGTKIKQEFILALEHAIRTFDVKLVMIMGHEDCQETKVFSPTNSRSTFVRNQLRGTSSSVRILRSVIQSNDRSIENAEQKRQREINEVKTKRDEIFSKSYLLRKLIDDSNFKFISAYYNLSTGVVDILDKEYADLVDNSVNLSISNKHKLNNPHLAPEFKNQDSNDTEI